MDYLKEAKEMFQHDIYATETTGIVIDEADEGYGKCSMKIERRHMNAGNMVMGGAIFTLADFAFGIAANVGNPTTVTLNSTISYINVAKGDTLIAEAHVVKSGKSTCVVNVSVYDNLGNEVAISTMTGFRKNKQFG